MLSVIVAAGVVFAAVTATLSVFLYLPSLAVAESLSTQKAAARCFVWLAAALVPVFGGLLAAGYGLYAALHDPYGSPHLVSGRVHLCARWIQRVPDASLFVQAIGWVSIALFVAGLVRFVAGAVRSSRTAARFREASPGASELAIIEHPEAFLATVGFLQPVTVVTSAVVNLLPGDELAAALAHELAHHRRSDNVLDLLMSSCVTCLPWVPTLHLYRRYRREDAERACDDSAAAEYSAQVVASGIRRLAEASREKSERKLLPSALNAWRWYVDVHRRVERLMAERATQITLRHEATYAGVLLTLAGVGVVVLALVATARQAADSVYCLAETLLGILRR
ncbi:MAG: M48 family metalloprotease [Armatimonadetes bacterium]|nr:M48 family metalloprotease [Armatimonadota bacterium]